MRHNSREYLGAFAAKEKLLTVEAGMKSDLENPEAWFGSENSPSVIDA